jgi:hypothetical protein
MMLMEVSRIEKMSGRLAKVREDVLCEVEEEQGESEEQEGEGRKEGASAFCWRAGKERATTGSDGESTRPLGH